MSHIPRKRFGQHFLTDPFIIDRIVALINPQTSDQLVEIGPGLGALTLPVLRSAKRLSVIELDSDLVPLIKKACHGLGDLTVYAEDALTFAWDRLTKVDVKSDASVRILKSDGHKLRVFGNLPYNISTPLLFHVLEYAHYIQDMTFMLQKEVVERLTAAPGSHAYGRLSVMVQYQCSVVQWLTVPAQAFSPPPKVESAMVHLVPYVTPPYIADDPLLFAELVKLAFGQRRKTLKNALKNRVDEKMWEMVAIDHQQRAEMLSVQNYVELSNVITRHFAA
jgi:16S rRNA (adenine1518-N6/adenine1519-N6)-dimethyltransferase